MLKFGLGVRSRFTAEDILKAAKVGKEYFDAIGHGLNIGGLNIRSLDHELKLPEETKKLIIFGPESDPIELECEFTGEEPEQPMVEPESEAPVAEPEVSPEE